MFESREKNDLDLLTCRALDAHGVQHGFTSRQNGFGARDNGPNDHAALARALELSGTVHMKQVHGCEIKPVAADAGTPECDAVVTAEPGLGIIVHTADCVPLLMWAENANTVSAVHAGWRGTLACVVAKTVEKLVDDNGVSPEELHVALGPAIRGCCFEVGDEVVEAFLASGRDADVISRPGRRGRRHIDLIEDNQRQLLAAGVRADRIYDSGLCTVCENERYYSYRKEGKRVGRLMGVIAVRS